MIPIKCLVHKGCPIIYNLEFSCARLLMICFSCGLFGVKGICYQICECFSKEARVPWRAPSKCYVEAEAKPFSQGPTGFWLFLVSWWQASLSLIIMFCSIFTASPCQLDFSIHLLCFGPMHSSCFLNRKQERIFPSPFLNSLKDSVMSSFFLGSQDRA